MIFFFCVYIILLKSVQRILDIANLRRISYNAFFKINNNYSANKAWRFFKKIEWFTFHESKRNGRI